MPSAGSHATREQRREIHRGIRTSGERNRDDLILVRAGERGNLASVDGNCVVCGRHPADARVRGMGTPGTILDSENEIAKLAADFDGCSAAKPSFSSNR